MNTSAGWRDESRDDSKYRCPTTSAQVKCRPFRLWTILDSLHCNSWIAMEMITESYPRRALKELRSSSNAHTRPERAFSPAEIGSQVTRSHTHRSTKKVMGDLYRFDPAHHQSSLVHRPLYLLSRLRCVSLSRHSLRSPSIKELIRQWTTKSLRTRHIPSSNQRLNSSATYTPSSSSSSAMIFLLLYPILQDPLYASRTWLWLCASVR